MQSMFFYTVAQCMPKLSKIEHTQAYTGSIQFIFFYTEAYCRPKSSKVGYTQALMG